MAIRTREIARLALPSGQLVACDPLVYLERARRFTRQAPRGSFPVVLTDLGPRSDILMASVRFGERFPVRWEPALLDGESEGEIRGYPVDAGTGCYVDATIAALAPRDGLDLLERARVAGYDREGYADLVLDGATGGNLVLFRSGAGDGSYPVFWGLDAHGAPAALVTDFGGESLSQIAAGDPVPHDGALTLFDLRQFVRYVATPTESWQARVLGDAGLKRLWDACEEPWSLLAILIDTGHTEAQGAASLWLRGCEDFCAAHGRPESPSIAAAREACEAGKTPLGEALRDGQRMFDKAFDAVYPRRKVDMVETVIAMKAGREPPDPNQGRRDAQRVLKRRACSAIRAHVPAAPSYESFVSSISIRIGPS
jgi:hypothetical protein